MYRSIEEIKATNVAHGGYWFSDGAMSFFGSRISKEVIGGCLFVSSEEFPSGGRRYSIRRADQRGTIMTVGDFGQYATLDQAKRAARRMVEPPDGSEGSNAPNRETLTTPTRA